jgi:Ser/Thr protein kinase RdoA (MazF antagonist)
MRRRWTDQKARKVANEACAALELPSSSAQLVHVGSNATYRIGDLAIRVAAPGTELAEVALELELASALKAAQVPALEPFAKSPLRLPSGNAVSLWHYLEHDRKTQVPAKAFGRLLAQYHEALRDSPLKPQRLEIIELLQERLDAVEQAGVVARDDIDMLRTRVEAVGKRLKRVTSELGEGVLHGDAQVGNVIVGPLGPVLSDFEHAAFGPLEWDLMPTALRRERFGLDAGDWDAFSEGYGYDVRRFSGYEPYLAARGLQETLRALADYQRCRKEAETRLRFWRNTLRSAPTPLWQSL